MPKTASSSRCQLSAKESLVQVQISDSSAADDRPFVPTVTAIATAPNLEWMVLSTDISSVGSCKGEKTKKTHLSQKKTHTSQKKAHTQQSKQTGRLGQSKRKASKEQLSPEEEERRRVRRERNKLAAAKCRNRRRQLTDSLQAETDSLEEEKADLEAEIDNLMKEKEQLSLLLMSHEPHCNMSAELEEKNDQKDKEVMKEKEEEEELVKREALEDCSPKKSSTIPDTSVSLVSSVNLEKVPTSPVALQQEPIISGDSDVLLCSSAALEPYIDIKDVSMEEMGPKLEYEDDMDLLVPDIDLSSSLGLTEWETLYMTMGENLEPLMFDLEESDSGKVKSGVDNSVLLTL